MKNILLLTLVISCLETFAQSITQEDRAKANAYFVAADWQNVVLSYQAIAKQEPQNANARMRAGIGLLNQSKTQPAIKQLEEATVLGPNPMAFFYLATAYAQANQKEKCVASLNQALTNGFSALSLFETDVNLAKLKSTPELEQIYQGLLKGVYANILNKQGNLIFGLASGMLNPQPDNKPAAVVFNVYWVSV